MDDGHPAQVRCALSCERWSRGEPCLSGVFVVGVTFFLGIADVTGSFDSALSSRFSLLGSGKREDESDWYPKPITSTWFNPIFLP